MHVPGELQDTAASHSCRAPVAIGTALAIQRDAASACVVAANVSKPSAIADNSANRIVMTAGRGGANVRRGETSLCLQLQETRGISEMLSRSLSTRIRAKH